MIIAIDFDGTCVTHEFPNVGKDIGAVPILKQLVEQGHQLILYTMRSNILDPNSTDPDIINNSGVFLDDAINWFKTNEIELYGIQTNPTQLKWSTSPKCYAQLYIDDAALGCPLTYNHEYSERMFVDWNKIYDYLIINKILV